MPLPATIIVAVLGAVNGYVFSKCKFKGSNLLFIAFAFRMFIPYQSIILSLVKFLQTINLYGTVLGLMAVHVVYVIPITAMLFRNFFDTLPNELIEAAKIDGATLIDVLLRIMLPLARPAFIVAGIYQFTNIWNDFLFGVTIVPNPKAQPITVALNNLSGSFSVDWNVVMAGAVIAAIPTALIYIFLGKFFVRGMLAGSVKGEFIVIMGRFKLKEVGYDISIIGSGVGGGTLAYALWQTGLRGAVLGGGGVVPR